MPERNPVSADPMTAGAMSSAPWATAGATLEAVPATYWLATVRPDGAPHVRPVLAAWVDGGLFFSAGENTRKARNLVRDSRCVVTVEQEPLDLVLEGRAVKVRDAPTLRRVTDAYAKVYRHQGVFPLGIDHPDQLADVVALPPGSDPAPTPQQGPPGGWSSSRGSPSRSTRCAV
jgi:Pyridoxamine 5'-phosphate oxidase